MEKKNNHAPSSKQKLIANILLISTTILWGTTFIITKNLTQEVPIFLYLGLRFSFAIIGFLPYFIHIKKINKKIILYGALTGLIYCLAIIFQTFGLQTTTAGKAGFITGLSTIMVPFLTWFWYKKKLKKRIWLAVIISVIGMALLLLEGESGIVVGDFLVLICAVFCAFHIVLTYKFVKLVDVYLYSIVQLTTISLFCFGSSFLFNESYDIINAGLPFWLIMIYMGVIVTAGTFIFQNWSQKHQGPSQTAIIFTLEPVFAVIFASFIIGNETMSLVGWLGCTLIFIAILITVLKNNADVNKRD